jgi:hypothetical protein
MSDDAGTRGRWLLPVALAVLLVSIGAVVPAYATELTGTWSGHWRSHTNNHTGPMKARVTRINASQYEVRFSGRFCTIIPFCYTETLNVVCDDGQTVELAASRNLGCLFGTFHMRAAANCCYFNANYSSESDQGYFALTRTGN